MLNKTMKKELIIYICRWGMDYFKEKNEFVEENVNEIIYDRLFKGGCSCDNIDEYRKTRIFRRTLIIL